MRHEPEPVSAVVTDLDAQWAAVQQALDSAAVVVLPGHVEGAGPCVDYGGDLSVLLRVVTELRPRVVYVNAVQWSEEVIENFVALCRLAGADDQDYPGELTAQRHANTRQHVGTLASVGAAVVFDGVRHQWSMASPWFAALSDDVDAIVRDARASRDTEWEREQAELDAQRDQQAAYLDSLTEQLLADDQWLMLGNDKTRREHATTLARASLGREVCTEQWVRGRISGAVQVATHRRDHDVIPAACETARASLPTLAAELAATGAYLSASTKRDRERVARALLLRAAPLVAPAELLSDLMALADARRQGGAQLPSASF